AADGDCAPGFVCDSAACIPRKPTCDGDHTLVGSDGTRTECAPYKCSGTQCLARCDSAAQCAPDHACNGDGVCIVPDQAGQTGGDAIFGGCSVAAGPPPSPPLPWLAVLLLRGRKRRR